MIKMENKGSLEIIFGRRKSDYEKLKGNFGVW